MELIKEIIIPNPPTKYIDRKKTKIDPNTGKFKENTYYLTGNLFLSSQNYFVISKILRDVKRYLLPHFKGLPKLDKMRIEFIYQKDKENFDLDNKGYFWQKAIMDILKTPSKRQIDNALKKRREIITTNTINDDTVKHLCKFSWEYKPGPHQLIVRIFGVESAPTLFE